MSFDINTNITSLQAQQYLRVNSDFQSKTINRVTSGLRILSSGDDAAGLAIANGFRSDQAVLSQGTHLGGDSGIGCVILILLYFDETGYRIADLGELGRETAEAGGCGAQKRKSGRDLCAGERIECDVTAAISGGLVERHLAASVQFDAQSGETLDGSRAVVIDQATQHGLGLVNQRISAKQTSGGAYLRIHLRAHRVVLSDEVLERAGNLRRVCSQVQRNRLGGWSGSVLARILKDTPATTLLIRLLGLTTSTPFS